MKVIKAHCPKYDKWFKLSVDDRGQIDNFENTTALAAKACQTQVKGTSFSSAANLLPCSQCRGRRVGRCSHIERLGKCKQEYSFQCLYCDQLRISLEAADSRYSQYVGQSNISGAALDKYGNPQGEQYDLAKRNGFQGFSIIILCGDIFHFQGENFEQGMREGPIPALKSKGFNVRMISPDDREFFIGNHYNAQALSSVLQKDTQLWIISSPTQYFDMASAAVVERFYKNGGGLYLWGDNDPWHADADYMGKRLFGVTMSGEYEGEHVIGVRANGSLTGIIPGHPISTGIAHFYEGCTIAAVKTNQNVLPLVYSSDQNVVTAYSEQNGRRLLIDGGFTRLYYKWNSAGTDRFVTNCAAWLANADSPNEVPFT